MRCPILPKLVIQTVKLDDGRRVRVVRDDLVPGGSKQRVLERILPGGKEYIYPAPAYGYGQVALAFSAKAKDLARRFSFAKRETLHPLTARAKAAGARIIQVPNGMLTLVKARAREHALKNASTRILLQEGFDYPEFRDELSAIAHEARLHPDQVWCCVGTGTLARSMQLAWPKADFKVVRTGMKPVLGDGMELYEAVPTKNLV
jgi:hypothetical protein